MRADDTLHIGVDGRELLGRPTGVGRHLRNTLAVWHGDPNWPHRLTIFVPSDPSDVLRSTFPRFVWHVSHGSGGTLWEQTRLPAALRRAGVHVLFAPAYTAPVLARCPVVVLIHDVSFFAIPASFPWRERWRRQVLTRRAARQASVIVTVSAFSAREIVRWLEVPESRIQLAPAGAPAARRVARARRPPLVLYVGSIFERRHVPELIQGFALARRAVPDARLRIVGDNRTSPRIDVLALAESLGVRGAVEWKAYVDEEELDHSYAAARAFAFISDYEGYAMTPMEAISHGVPVVLADTVVAREVYADGAVFVSPHPEAIATALVALLTDDAAHADVLARGRARLAHYSWTTTATVIRTALEDAARP
jgi:glycosyltransferase involved in cell wall biosynthesis